MLTKDGKDVSPEMLTPENYKVPAGEERLYHLVQEVKQFDTKTGRKISNARVQKYGRKLFEKVVRDQLMKQGYEITILHNPTAYLEALKKAKAEAAAKTKAEKEAEEKAKFDVAVQAAVAEKLDAAVAAAVKKALAAEKKAETKAKKEEKTGE